MGKTGKRRQVSTLEELGRQINKLDSKIILLLAKRARLAKKVEERKRLEGRPILRQEAEEERLAKIHEWAGTQGVNPHFARSILYQLISESCRIQIEQRESNNKAR